MNCNIFSHMIGRSHKMNGLTYMQMVKNLRQTEFLKTNVATKPGNCSNYISLLHPSLINLFFIIFIR